MIFGDSDGYPFYSQVVTANNNQQVEVVGMFVPNDSRF